MMWEVVLNVLEAVERSGGETDSALSRRVQRLIKQAFGVHAEASADAEKEEPIARAIKQVRVSVERAVAELEEANQNQGSEVAK